MKLKIKIINNIENLSIKYNKREIQSIQNLTQLRNQILNSRSFSVQNLFNIIDRNNIHAIDFENLIDFFHENKVYPYEEEIILILKRFDKKEIGRIDFEDFSEIFPSEENFEDSQKSLISNRKNFNNLIKNNYKAYNSNYNQSYFSRDNSLQGLKISSPFKESSQSNMQMKRIFSMERGFSTTKNKIFNGKSEILDKKDILSNYPFHHLRSPLSPSKINSFINNNIYKNGIIIVLFLN